jgi:hypothetical protein
MLEAVSKEIDGIAFKYQPMMATPARTLFDKLVNKMGPALAGALEGVDQANDLTLSEDTEDQMGMLSALLPALGKGIRELSAALNENFHREIVKTLGAQTQIEQDGNWISLDKNVQEVLFAQKLTLEFKWIAFCLGVQYEDFLALSRTAALQTVISKAFRNESRSNSQRTSTGSFSGSQQASDTAQD